MYVCGNRGTTVISEGKRYDQIVTQNKKFEAWHRKNRVAAAKDTVKRGGKLNRGEITMLATVLFNEFESTTKWKNSWDLQAKQPWASNPKAKGMDLARLNIAEQTMCASNVLQCPEVFEVMQWAWDVSGAEQDPSIDNNAYRHALWQARMTVQFGTKKAEAWAEAHEAYYAYHEQDDHVADLYNNLVARTMGEELVQEARKENRIGFLWLEQKKFEPLITRAKEFARSDQFAYRGQFEYDFSRF